MVLPTTFPLSTKIGNEVWIIWLQWLVWMGLTLMMISSRVPSKWSETTSFKRVTVNQIFDLNRLGPDTSGCFQTNPNELHHGATHSRVQFCRLVWTWLKIKICAFNQWKIHEKRKKSERKSTAHDDRISFTLFFLLPFFLCTGLMGDADHPYSKFENE